MNRPSAAVVTPTVGSRHLHQAIRSVQAQTYPHVRHLVVIDGPAFAGAAEGIVREYTGGDRRIDVLRLPYNTGCGVHRGHRVYAASPFLCNADVLFNLDDDNWFDPEHVEDCIATLERRRCDWTHAFRRIRLADGSPVCEDDADSIGRWPRHQTLALGTGCLPAPDEAFLATYRHLVDTSCYAIRRHLYARVAHRWVYGHGADSIVADVLIRTAPVASTTRTTVNYRLGSASSAGPSFFLEGNATMRRLYGATYPWRQPQEARLGPAAHAPG